MPKSKLIFFSKSYKILDSQSLIICNVTNEEDRKFHFQLRFIQKKSQKINLNQFETGLNDHIVIQQIRNSLYFNDENKITLLNYLKDLGIDLDLTEIIQNNILFKAKNSTLIKTYDKNSIHLFRLESASNFNFGYEISENFSESNLPLACMQIFSGKQLSRKIYLFPADSKSLIDTVSKLKKNSNSNLENLGSPYVEYLLSKSSQNSKYDKEIQTRINLQAIISEEIIRLKHGSRESAKKKIDTFLEISKRISENTPLDQLGNYLDSDDIKKILSVHRDLFSFFINTFFKFKTHSECTLEELRTMLPKQLLSEPTSLNSR